jgi:hypothetical protein
MALNNEMNWASSEETIPLIPVHPDQEPVSAGTTLLQALQKRKTIREFAYRGFSMETLSRLLWCAFGINRPVDGRRTAPSAQNWQEIDIYVSMASGLYLFDAKAFTLQLVLKEDIRGATGWQDFVSHVPVNLVYVADLHKLGDAPRTEQKFYAALDTGFISQNIYLFCATEGLATVVRGWVDRPALAQIMKLAPNQRVIAAQSVGYPKD